MCKSVRRLWPVLLALVPLACSRLEGNIEAENDSEPLYELSADEVRLARDLAERDLDIPRNPLSPLERVVFAKIDLLPDAQADTTQRLVMVQHYRYRGDETILTTVDLNRLEVLGVERLAHYPTALAREEMERAESMARADSRLQPILDMPNRRLHIEGRPFQPAFPHEPLFGHRVVLLLLRDGISYLNEPRILVDLTTEAVIFDF